jgi:hypothetical protein
VQDALHEPVTVTIVLGLAKIVVPAVAGVVTTWLATRGGSGRKGAAHVRHRGERTADVNINELVTKDVAAARAKIDELAKADGAR